MKRKRSLTAAPQVEKETWATREGTFQHRTFRRPALSIPFAWAVFARREIEAIDLRDSPPLGAIPGGPLFTFATVPAGLNRAAHPPDRGGAGRE